MPNGARGQTLQKIEDEISIHKDEETRVENS